MNIKKFLTALLTVTAILFAADARAFQISTMVHEIDPARTPFSDFYIYNDSRSEPLHLVITLRGWNQNEDGSRNLTNTDDIIAFPNLLVIEPGERRKVRIGLQKALPEEVEHAYRLNVRQLAIEGTTAGAPAAADTLSGAVKFTRSFDMPVFVRPQTPEQNVAVRAVRDNGKVAIEVRNIGNVNVKLRDLALYQVAGDGGSKPLAEPISAVRLLARSRIVVGAVSVADLKSVSAVEPHFKVSSGDVDEDRVGERLQIKK